VLTAEYRQQYDILALARQAAGDDVRRSEAKGGRFENWLPVVDAFRTLVTCPPPESKATFQQIHTFAA